MTNILLSAMLLLGCASPDIEPDPGGGTPPPVYQSPDARYPVIASEAFPAPQEKGDIIPDFSRVGYRWGDRQIPDVAIAVTLTPPANGADATQLIQNAIDNTSSGAILLTRGTYNVYGTLTIAKNNIVLRGEGQDDADGTVLVAAGTTQRPLIVVGGTGTRKTYAGGGAGDVKDDYVPAGRFWIRVANAPYFKVGDNVVIYRPSPQNWITDLKMDQIPPRSDGLPITQWQAGKFDTYAERVVTLVSGDTLHFENPVVMALDANYGRGQVRKYDYPDRVSECGIENMLLKSEYAGPTDEDHGWNAIEVKAAEHCWVRNITAKHFGMGLASLDRGSKNITVTDCTCVEPVSTLAGSRRYSFHINQGQLCLVKNCASDDARHDYATGSMNAGPNVFTNCTATNPNADIGPHQRWNMGTLYDRITSDGEICVQDRSNYGSGQGWAATTNVLWNCRGSVIIVQSPWVSGYNYSIGSVGRKSPGKFTDPLRPDGVWVSAGSPVVPQSLYEAQLELRRTTQPGGVMDISTRKTKSTKIK